MQMPSSAASVTSIVRRPLHHVGFTVADLETAMQTWVNAFGAGPFFRLPHVSFDEISRDGEPAVWDHTAAFTRTGSVRIELQEQHELQSGLEQLLTYNGANTLNHLAFTVEDPAAESARLQTLGFDLGLYTRFAGLEFFLHDAGQMFGCAIELISASSVFESFWSKVDEAVANWDGADPVRPFQT